LVIAFTFLAIQISVDRVRTASRSLELNRADAVSIVLELFKAILTAVECCCFVDLSNCLGGVIQTEAFFSL
jgi:hypothetical protein